MAKQKCPMCGDETGEIDSIDKRTIYLYCNTCKPIVKSIQCDEHCLNIGIRSGESPYVLDHHR